MVQEVCKKIGFLGGTFNPIHFGHLIIAETIRDKFELDKVLFIPTGMPPHKSDLEVADAEHRYNMVNCAISSNPGFEALRIEIDRAGFTYSIDTLTALRKIYGDNSSLYFIIGDDIIPELVNWRDYKEVFKMCEFIVVSRTCSVKEELLQYINRLKEKFEAVIHVVETPIIEISSTDIRQRILSHNSIKYLTPECVVQYINEHRLYMKD